MRLRTNIFLWVSLATVLPLTAIVLGATAYSERQHQGEVDRQMAGALNTLVAEFDRRLAYEREVVAALAVSPPMQQFKPVLAAALEGRRHAQFHERATQLASFLEEFQSVLLDIGTLRVTDARGNTVVKVRFGRRSPAAFEGMDPYPYVEPELQDRRLLADLRAALPGEVGYVLLPPALSEFGDAGPAPMLDAMVALRVDGQSAPVGYLLVSSTGVQIDRILELSPRLNHGQLVIAEQNPDRPERDGLVLFDEAAGERFSRAKSGVRRLGDLYGGELLRALRRQPFGAFTTADGRHRIYYTEYLPYPNELVSWVVAVRVDSAEIAAPFRRIRLGILLFAAVALLLSLGLAQLGARRIARPITQLAARLKAYAQGERLPPPRRHSSEEIAELHASFDYMADTLERAQRQRDEAERKLLQSAKLASLGELAAGIGHEMNNPLTNILSLVKLMERELPPEATELRGDLRSLGEEAERASRIVRGVLDFARQSPPRYTRIAAADWVQDSLALVAPAARDAGVRLRTEVEPDLWLEGDPNQLQQVLINLLLNAIQASEPGGQIVVQARREGGERVAICVRDQGAGIDPAIMDKLFDPFFTTKPVGKGSGLGLSVSLGIVEHHGGRIRLYNNEGGGATAVVELPLHRHTGGVES